jgi:hypothetical protein
MTLQLAIIPSLAIGPFSALTFLGTYKFYDFMKLRLSNLVIMAEPTKRRSNRSRKPIVHFDNQIGESIRPSKPLKPTKSTIKPSIKPIAKSTSKSIIKNPLIPNPIEQLYSQIEGCNRASITLY